MEILYVTLWSFSVSEWQKALMKWHGNPVWTAPLYCMALEQSGFVFHDKAQIKWNSVLTTSWFEVYMGPGKEIFECKTEMILPIIQSKHVFRVLKRTVSMRYFFLVPS